MRKDYLDTARQLLAEKFPNSKCAFVAGSVTCGQATAASDIDIVIVHDLDALPKAYRESIFYNEWPIETFIQNTNSLAYFFEKDIAGGIPVLINMVAEGFILPENNPRALALKDDARKIMERGPAALSAADNEKYRYMITDNLDDISDYKNMAELYGSLCALYQELGNFYLRANRKWSGRAKSMTRAIKNAFPELLPEYEAAFKEGFAGNVGPVLELADKLLAPFGGRYWGGWLQYAPEEANS
jgi:hypothetical protein